jgi:dolichyl-diphosphooligosaccharide--protein glycosyltransferase
MLLPLYNANSSYTQWPKENGITVEAMDYVKNNTPDDSILWAWWDHGYAITYWARRATINDGSIHGGERTVYNAIPYATDSYRLSANFMHFYVTHGIDGIRKFYNAVGNSSKGLKNLKEILDAGPDDAREIIDSLNLTASSKPESTEDWLEFFFPENNRPVYILIDNLLTKIAYWWFWFGTWDIDKQEGIHPSFNFYYNINSSNNIISNNSGLKIDSQNGILYSRDLGSYQLSHISKMTSNKLNKKEFNTNSRLGFEYIESYRFGALCDNNISESVFNKLFIRHSYQEKYFKPIRLRGPYYQIWEVKGDTYRRSKTSN